MGIYQKYGTSHQFFRSVTVRKIDQSKLDEIVSMYKSGKTLREIAESCGVTVSAVSYHTRGLSRCVNPPNDVDGEEWREVDGFDGRYLVSNMGRVFSTGKFGRKCGVMSLGNCRGYRTVGLTSDCGTVSKRVHRLVADAFVPGRSFDRNQVNHINGDRSDNRAENLEWVTQSENILHAYHVLGNVNKGRKLTARQVRNIRSSEHGAKYLARRYKVSRTTIREIKQRIRYKDVE